MIGFHLCARLMNGHFFRVKWLDQIEGFSRGAGKSGLVIVWLQNAWHSVWMHFGYQLIWFRCDDRGRQNFPRILPVDSIKKGPNSGKRKRWSRIFAFQTKPKKGGRSLPFWLAKTGGRDKVTPYFKTRLPEPGCSQFVISGVVHYFRLDWKSRSGRSLRQHKAPVCVF